jgi:2-dehydropantoate 2-reductase
MTAHRTSRIVVAGAGSIGCYVGGCLALAGRSVVLLARPAVAEMIARFGLRITDLEGADRTAAPSDLAVTADPAAALARADIVLVTVKSGATREMAALIAQHAPPGAIIVSLQNGVDNIAALRACLGDSYRLVPGMVPFNVVQSQASDQPLRVHRATSGTILIAAGEAGLRDCLDVDGAHVAEHADMAAIQWGKLLFNLNNALNALSGLPLAQQLGDRVWRRLLAAQMGEALATLKAAAIKPASVEGVPFRAIPLILSLPDPLFRLVARRMLAIDPAARSSMWEDLERRRPTEIDHLQGAILTLAQKARVPVPLTERIVEAVKAAERAGAGSPRLQAAQLARTAP